MRILLAVCLLLSATAAQAQTPGTLRIGMHRNIEGVSDRIAGFTLLADGLLRLQDVRPK